MLVAAPRRRPAPVAAAATIVVGLLALLLAGCGRPAAGELVVPVLWAAGSGDASTGGVERARVLVGDGDGGYTVDLADSRAEGAGPAWLAASASAATVATLVSGVDPSSIRIRFTVTGRIDGPSGGAALAVGVLAAIRGQTLREGVTMTGTISPDAAVGRVSGVPAKVRAAADEGFDLVLVPVGNAGDRDPGTGLDVVALGASLGVEVRPVADLGEAVAAFTGGPITAGPDSAPLLTPAVDAVAASTAAAMVTRLDAALASSAVPPAARAVPTARLAAAQQALADGALASAYGTAADGWLRLVRDSAAESTVAAANAGGLDPERMRLEAEAAAVVAAAEAALARAGDPATRSVVARLNLPAALGWLTYARAVAESVDSSLPTVIAADQMGELAGTLAELRANVDVMWPDALAAVDELVDGDASLPADPGAFLDGYTMLIESAARANEGYAVDVLGSLGADPVTTQVAAGATVALSTLVAGGSSPEVRAAAALSWWFITTEQVAGRQSYGLDRFGLGTDVGVPADQPALDKAVRNASETVTAAAGNLAGRGVDTSYPVWVSAWAVASAEADVAAGAADGEVLALGELWSAVVTANVLTAATSPPDDGPA
jgi:hypothetical protein